jgi:hypothetical protein
MKKILLLSSLILSLDLLSQNYDDSVSCRQTISMYRKIESKLQSNITSQVNTLKLKNSEISLLNETIIKSNKDIKRQKIYKWISIVSAASMGIYIIKN